MPIWSLLLERSAARDLTTPPTALVRLAHGVSDLTVALNIAANPNTPPAALHVLLEQANKVAHHPRVLDAIAQHKRASTAIKKAANRYRREQETAVSDRSGSQ